MHAYASDLYKKPKKLDPYKDWILAWLEEYPLLSAAQIKYWLLECYPELDVGESTVRLYVRELREMYQIEKKAYSSIYCSTRWANRFKSIGEKQNKNGQLVRREIVFHCICFSTLTP